MNHDSLLEELEAEIAIRGFSRKTMKSYSYFVKKFLLWVEKDKSLKGRLEVVESTDVKRYLLFLVKQGYQESTIRLSLAALNFFFENVVGREVNIKNIPRPKKKKTLPKTLAKKQVKRMIKIADNKKHKLAIMLLYSAGLRVSELVKLKKQDFDFENNLIRIRQSKGKKDRVTILSEKTTKPLLEHFWNLEGEHVFPGKNKHYSTKTIQEIVAKAGKKARVGKKVTPHMLRHSFATHLLEEGTSIRIIQKLLGHTRLETTQVYTHIADSNLKNIKSPFDKF